MGDVIFDIMIWRKCITGRTYILSISDVFRISICIYIQKILIKRDTKNNKIERADLRKRYIGITEEALRKNRSYKNLMKIMIDDYGEYEMSFKKTLEKQVNKLLCESEDILEKILRM